MYTHVPQYYMSYMKLHMYITVMLWYMYILYIYVYNVVS